MSFTKEEIKIEEQKIYYQLRAAKCVIALEGLSDDALDGGWNYKDFSAYICRIEIERDELLEALEAIIDSGELPLCYSSPLVIKANKAIAKAKGEK